jgi:putative holliday junction resolvase
MSRLLALDIGRKRTGVACTDENRIIASSLETVETHKLELYLRDYLSKNSVELVVVGHPKDMQNNDSDGFKYIEPVFNRLKKVFNNVEFVYRDERFTSKMAFQTMIDTGVKKMKRREKSTVDKISATIILQAYLDELNYKR